MVSLNPVIQQHPVNTVSETDIKANSLKEALDGELKYRQVKKLQATTLLADLCKSRSFSLRSIHLSLV
jgi:hypothetical protein